MKCLHDGEGYGFVLKCITVDDDVRPPGLDCPCVEHSPHIGVDYAFKKRPQHERHPVYN